MSPRSSFSSAFPFVLFAGVMLIAANLRAPFTGVAPLMVAIQNELTLSASTVGLLITLPLLVFMLVSPLVPAISRRFGIERTLFLALVVIAVGVLVRSIAGLYGLLGGTVLIGAGIAAGNVLLPGVVKLRFPNHIALLTSSYVLAMGIVAAAWSAAVIPLANGGPEWEFALLAMVGMPVVSALLWLNQLKDAKQRAPDEGPHQGAGKAIFGHRLTWQLCGFFGCNAFLYYSVVSWLPAIVNEAGFSEAQAGNIHGIFQFASALPGFVIVPAMKRLHDQRGLSVSMTALNLVGFAGLMLFPQFAYAWSAVLGFAIGANFILALSFIGLRTRTSNQASSLSSAAQTTGYCVAATGPFALGAVYDWVGGWQLALFICVAFSISQALLGLKVGRNIQLPLTPENSVKA